MCTEVSVGADSWWVVLYFVPNQSLSPPVEGKTSLGFFDIVTISLCNFFISLCYFLINLY